MSGYRVQRKARRIDALWGWNYPAKTYKRLQDAENLATKQRAIWGHAFFYRVVRVTEDENGKVSEVTE